MKNVSICIVLFDGTISEREIPSFRGAIIALSGNNPMFHNHSEESGDIFRYPKVQYKIMGNCPLDEDLSVFIASAGLIVANADDKVTDKEIEHIIQNLARLQILPKRFLDAIARADMGKLFTQSAQNILKQNPGMRDGILEYMMSLVLSDKEIAKEEIGLIYGFGNDIGFTDKEISVKFASMIQRNYVPSLESIS